MNVIVFPCPNGSCRDTARPPAPSHGAAPSWVHAGLVEEDEALRAKERLRCTIGGARSTFRAMKDGEAKITVVLNWACTYDLGESWLDESEISNSTQWRVTVEGDPSMRLTFEQADHFGPGGDVARKSTEHSFIITVMNVLHAIPYLAKEATPGIKHYGNLPLMAGRYTMR